MPDVVEINGSGVLTFIGGGGGDAGLAFPFRGQDAGMVYLYGTFKKMDLNKKKISILTIIRSLLKTKEYIAYENLDGLLID